MAAVTARVAEHSLTPQHSTYGTLCLSEYEHDLDRVSGFVALVFRL